VAAPRPDEIGYIRDTYFQLASAGRGAAQHHAGLTKLAHALPRRGRSPDGSPSLLPQRNHRIDARRPARGHIACHQRQGGQ
jgi:hypothetical protein